MKPARFLRAASMYLFCGGVLLAQDPLDFFPHHLGDLWEYSWLVNAYDRHWLRWVDYIDLDISDSLDVSVSDYLTSGDAYRIALPGTSGETFFVENHQELSYFDNWVYWDGSGKGLYIYHVRGTGAMPRFDMEIAEGRFDWSNPFWILNPWGTGQPGDSIPVYTQIPNEYPQHLVQHELGD